LLARIQRIGFLSNGVHHAVGDGLISDASINAGPVQASLSSALGAIVVRSAGLEAANVGPPFGSVVEASEPLSASLDHVALAFVGTMLASEGFVRVLASVSIRPQTQIHDAKNAGRFHSSIQVSRDEGFAPRSQTFIVKIKLHFLLSAARNSGEDDQNSQLHFAE